MKKILVIGESATLSHVGRPFVLAKELMAYGYELHFACDTYFKHLLPESELTCHTIKSQPPEQFTANIKKGLPLYSKATLSQYIEEDLRLLSLLKPDVVIGDFRLSLSISARISNIPYINIINAHWSPYCKPYLPLPKHPLSKLLGYKLANRLFQWTQPLIFYFHLTGINSLRTQYNLKPYRNLMEYYSDADITLYPDLEHLVPTLGTPATHHYIGPIHFEPYCNAPEWLNEINKTKPIIYFSLGSSGDESILTMMIEILGEIPATILYAKGTYNTRKSFPSNFYIADYLPGMEMCRYADLIITHGGMPSVYQALECSTPVIGLASNIDHLKSMRPIEQAQFGMVIRSDQWNKKYITQTINRFLKNTHYKEKISAFMAQQKPHNAGQKINTIISGLKSN